MVYRYARSLISSFQNGRMRLSRPRSPSTFPDWGAVAGWLSVQRLGWALNGLLADPTPLLSVVVWSLFTLVLMRRRRSPLLQKASAGGTGRGAAWWPAAEQFATPLLYGCARRSRRQSRSNSSSKPRWSAPSTRCKAHKISIRNASPIVVAEEQSAQAAELAAVIGQPAADAAYARPAALVSDAGTDSDADCLTDYLEERLGTDPQQSDSDGDLVSDAREVNGAQYQRQDYGIAIPTRQTRTTMG